MIWTKKDRETVWQPRNGRMTSKQKISYVMKEKGVTQEVATNALRMHDWHIASALSFLGAALKR